MNKTFYIRTYGCQMNQYEEGVITTIMNDAGYTKVSLENDADIIYLVTCSVRKHAEQRALGRLSVLYGLKKTKPDLIIGILGCMAQEMKDILLNQYKVDLVAGPDDYRRLPEMIDNFTKSSQPQMSVDFSCENYEGIIPKPDDKITGFISIMRGCNNFCTYCIVPYVRGRERSKSTEQIIKEVEALIRNGVKDITLVGQNVLAWQEQDKTFLDLIKLVNDLNGYDRLRFITSHPKDLATEHFEVFASLDKFCPHIHLPVQSGSDRILKLMNRGYTQEEYIEKIYIARKMIPDISFTTDVLVGFPTETDQDFNQTLELVQNLQYDYAYMFKYSERPNTKACNILPKVDSKIAQQRLSKLIEVQNKITEQKSKEFLNKDFEVLIESKNGTQSYARTRTNKQVIIKEKVTLGKLYNCKIIDVVGWTPIGKIDTIAKRQQPTTNNHELIYKEVS